MKKSSRYLAVLLSVLLIFGCAPVNLTAAEFTDEEATEEFGMELQEEEFSGEGSADQEVFSGEDSEGQEVFFDEVTEEDFLDEAQETSEENSVTQISMTYINPLYADEIEESDLRQPAASYSARTLRSSEPVYYTNTEDVGAVIREGMRNRQETIAFGYQSAGGLAQDIMKQMFESALTHTGNPAEGDYLRWQYGGWKASSSGYQKDKIWYYTFTYTMTYYTTAAQEAELNRKISEVLNELNLSGMNVYFQIKGIYDYICRNVCYDYANKDNDGYWLKNTAYAALINKTAVCQGYALLFYRMALEMGIDSRLIAGTGGSENHGWNIVKIQDCYYNVDATWDAGKTEYSYFLKCDSNFLRHTRNPINGIDCSSPEFYAAYPMGSTDYIYTEEPDGEPEEPGEEPEEPGEEPEEPGGEPEEPGEGTTDPEPCETHSWEQVAILKEPSCETPGEAACVCTVCGENGTEVIPATGHVAVIDLGKASTCVNKGLTDGSHCETCGETLTKQTEIPAKGHKWGAWKTISEATVFAPKKQQRTCTVCGKTETRETGSKLAKTIALSSTSFPLRVGQSVNVRVTKMSRGDYVYRYTTSNSSVARISYNKSTGIFTVKAQKKTGSATIKITLKSGAYAYIRVKVQTVYPTTTAIGSVPSKKTIQKGNYFRLVPVLTPISSKDKITYSTSNRNVAVVNSNGVIRAMNPGTAVITVKSGTKTRTCRITVPRIKATDISNVSSSKTLKKGQSFSLNPKLTPSNSTDTITYTSSNKKVATVTSAGRVKAVGVGKSIITVKAGSVYKRCVITVTK